MAIAGLHNVSPFSPSFFGETRRDQPSTQASTLLQIWREIEGEHVVNLSYNSRQHRNTSDSECLSTSTSFGRVIDNGDDISQHSYESENQVFTGSDMDHEENESITSEQSSDLGEIERERVRQIFREWMNSGSKRSPSYEFNINNRTGQWLGENECQRVRIIREWVQTTTQQRNNCGSVRDDATQFGSEIEQVRNGLAINHPEFRSRRCIRRLCGRQTLLDLLLRVQSERKSELVALSENRPVSEFAHRNRIQALLRGRFLRNERSIHHESTSSSKAATELSLLRQRHAVSDLRVEFLSKLENSASTSLNVAKSDTSSSGENDEELESLPTERELSGINGVSDSESASNTMMRYQELDVVQVVEATNHGLNYEGREQEVLPDVGLTNHMEEPVSDAQERLQGISTNVDNDSYGELADAVMIETEERCSNEHNEDHSENELRSDALNADAYAYEEIYLQDSLSQVEMFQETGIVIMGSASAELVNATEEEAGSSQEGTTNHQWSLEISQDNVEEQDHQMQASHADWTSQDFEEAIDSWLDMPSRAEDESFARIDTYYFPDDDNAHSMELRELFSRRRVSSLLRSGFRESLSQVLQSHVERLGHGSEDWEVENTPPQQEQERLNATQNLSLPDGSETNHFTLAPASSILTSQILWDEELDTANLPHHISDQQQGAEWEVINELRHDMARLQQRMDSMQNMVETCMDMQVELQRALRQEVSAALNRSNFPADANMSGDKSQWDHVRNGICCLCQDSRIDSLLYRCGHMCSCSRCAENLVGQKVGKCPMCEAPVIEVVKAYFVQ